MQRFSFPPVILSPTGVSNSLRTLKSAVILPPQPIFYAQAVEVAPGFALCLVRARRGAGRLGDNAAAADRASAEALAADPEDRHGAAVQLAWLTGEATPMPAGYVRALFDQYAKHYDLSLLEGLDYHGPQLLVDAAMAACSALGREPWFDRAARSRLRDGARERGVRAACGIAGRCRPLSRNDRAGTPHRPLQSVCTSPMCLNSWPMKATAALTSDRRRRRSPIAPISDRSSAQWRVCSTTAACLPSPSRPTTAVACCSGRRCATRTARIMCGPRWQGGALVCRLTAASSRREKNIPVPGLVVVAVKPASTVPPSGITSNA